MVSSIIALSESGGSVAQNVRVDKGRGKDNDQQNQSKVIM